MHGFHVYIKLTLDMLFNLRCYWNEINVYVPSIFTNNITHPGFKTTVFSVCNIVMGTDRYRTSF